MCKADLQTQARTLGIGDDCVFVPAKADVAEWLRSIDIFVLPSLSEGLSNSLMEAMACGCCAVASRTGGNIELVTDGRTGWLFEPGNAAELTSCSRTPDHTRCATEGYRRRRMQVSPGTIFGRCIGAADGGNVFRLAEAQLDREDPVFWAVSPQTGLSSQPQASRFVAESPMGLDFARLADPRCERCVVMFV